MAHSLTSTIAIYTLGTKGNVPYMRILIAVGEESVGTRAGPKIKTGLIDTNSNLSYSGSEYK